MRSIVSEQDLQHLIRHYHLSERTERIRLGLIAARLPPEKLQHPILDHAYRLAQSQDNPLKMDLRPGDTVRVQETESPWLTGAWIGIVTQITDAPYVRPVVPLESVRWSSSIKEKIERGILSPQQLRDRYVSGLAILRKEITLVDPAYIDVHLPA